MKRIIRILVLATMLSIMFVYYTFANTINIPADYSTIQAGIDAATNGDTVLVQPETYYENINFNGKNITVGSLFLTTQDTSYISLTIIDGNQSGSVVIFEGGESLSSLLGGFTLTNGSGTFYDDRPCGGGIFCCNSSPSLKLLAIIGNSAGPWHGGGLFLFNSNPNLVNVTISDNSADFTGGGLYCENSSPSLENTQISNNSTGFFGGGIYSMANSNPILTNVAVIGNSAGHSGGGICCESNSNPHLNNVIISNNSAIGGSGGGISCLDSSPIIENAEIYSNSSSDGGGIGCTNSCPILESVEIFNNSALSDGGGIWCNPNSSPSLNNVTITNNNTFYMNGGGIYCNGSSLSLENVIISDNSSDFSWGGGIFCEGSSLSMKNVTISGNIAYMGGGGIYFHESSSTLINVTLSENMASYWCNVISCTYNSGIIFVNCILWNDSLEELYITPSSTADVSYSDIQDGWAGTGNIDADPLFVDPLNGDYHLSWTNFPIQDSTMSPCIDAGDPSSPLDPDGTIADMGAYYFNQNLSVDDPQEITTYHFTNYPNPIGTNINNLTVSFSIHKPVKVKIQLFNIKGQLVSTLINEDKNIGDYLISHPVNDLSSGIYFTKMSVDGVDREIRKVVLLR